MPKMTQEQLRSAIDTELHVAQNALARTAELLTGLDAQGSFVSLAKVNADNLATMTANLKTRILHCGPE
jgi:hypothetical protein